MKFCSIASGSSGNCIYVGTEHTHLLVDAGISKKRIEEGLSLIGITGDDIDGILVTHEHVDHIQGLGVFTRKYHVPIYATAGTIAGIKANKCLGKMDEDLFVEISANETFDIYDFSVTAFCISHDAKEPTGYRFEAEGKRMAVATDLGCYDSYIVDCLSDLHAIVLEANHDIHMLEVGPYPYPLKQRVMGDKGHLSNELSGRLLCDILHENLQFVVLGHLSKDNNYAELALETVKLEVLLSNIPYDGSEFVLTVARRDCISNIFTIE